MTLELFTIEEGVGRHRLDLVIYTINITCTQTHIHPTKEIMNHHHQIRPLKQANNIYLNPELLTPPTLKIFHLIHPPIQPSKLRMNMQY